jgi:protein-S-isoprenylcysteine O-methyltransferase Ste14
MTFIKTLLFTVLVPGAVIVYIPFWLLTSPGGSLQVDLGSLWALGVLPFLLGVSIYLWCAWQFTFAGHGTPAPIAPPQYLVAGGLYRVVRNPMYVGVLTALLGEALLFHSLTLLFYAALVFVTVHLFVVCFEEPFLRQQFGASYQDYCAQVPRWCPRMSDSRRKSPSVG